MKSVQWLLVAVMLMGALLSPASALKPGNASDKGAMAADIVPAALWDGRKEVEFHAATLPKMVRVADARFLIDDEYVLGITSHGESRAYPTRFISWHHIINDRIGKNAQGGATFVTVTYCIVCNSGICFETPLVHDNPLQFDFYGLYNGVMTMFDKQTQSVWLQVTGQSVKGALCGTTLKRDPLLDTTWGAWKKLHPDTLVMAPDPRFNDCYERKGVVMVRGYTKFPAAYFRPTVTHRDTRLPMFAPVLAVRVPASEVCVAPAKSTSPMVRPHALYRAYPMQTFQEKTGVINDVMGNAPVAVFFLAGSDTMTAVSRELEGRTLTLETHKGSNKNVKQTLAFYDRETGSRWNVEGKAEAGPLAGRQLRRLESHMSQWYGWVSYFPQTSIYGQRPTLSQVSLKSGH